MKIKVRRRFFDRANAMVTREAGEVYEAPEERAEFLIQLGLADQAPEEVREPPAPEENEAVEAPNSGDRAEGKGNTEQPKKSANKGRKTAK